MTKSRSTRQAIFALVSTLVVSTSSHAASAARIPTTPTGAATKPARAPTPAHRHMLSLLEKISVDSKQHNAYLGTDAIDDLRAKLAKLPDDPRDPRRWQLNVWLGAELLRVGQIDASIASYARAVEQLDSIRDHIKRRDEADLCFQMGTAYMRLGESQNCCLKNDKESCILPIRGGGLHSDKHGSETAIEWFTRALALAKQDSPIYTKARWLLNIAHMTLDTYPAGVPDKFRIDPKVFASDEDFPHFTDIAPEVGLTEVALAGGAIAEDFDGDGRIDLMISSSDTSGQLRYYANDGSGGFVDRTEDANLLGEFGGLNMIDGDYDNDGDVDVLVLRGAWWHAEGRHPKSLLENDGHGVFMDVTFDVGLGDSTFPSQTGGFADFDNDGDLDLYVGNEQSDPAAPAPCQLYQNDGSGRFIEVAKRAGVTNDRYTKAVIWGDYDNDRFPDIYVSNMGADNRLYRNNRDGTFTDVARAAGVAGPTSSFPCWFFDFDNDGALDLWVGGFGGPGVLPNVADVAASYLGLPHQGEMMRLYKGDGSGQFTDVAAAQGLTLYTLPMGSNFGDLDNDGYLDMYLGTGYPFYEGLIPNVMYRNQHGKGFADVTTASGLGHLQKGHGVVFADLDNDGDQDLLERMGGAYLGDGYRCVLFQNPGFAAHWLKVSLHGEKSNRFGVGAKVRLDIVEDGAPRTIYKTVNTGGTFGANPLRQEIGVGSATKIDRLEVYWPTSDTRQVFRDVGVDQALEIREGAEAYARLSLRPCKLGL